MKLRQLTVESFGHFHQQPFEFDANFTLIFGPNEAGKSTLLQLVREQLFGFKHQNPYAFAEHGKSKMAAEAEIELLDGSRLRFRRQKGRPDVVKGESLVTGQPIDETVLTNLLGGMTPDRYAHLFGFSLQELTAGQASLNEANIGEALYGGAIGSLAGFQKLRSDLQSEADSLLTGRGRKKIIDGLLSEIKDQLKEQGEASVKPRDYKQLAKQCELAAANVELTRKRVGELQREATHLGRIAAAIDPWIQHRQAVEEISELSVPKNFPLDGAEQLRRLKERHAELSETQRNLETELQSDTNELAALQVEPHVIAHEAKIRLLQQQVKQIESCRVDSVKLEQNSRDVRAEVSAQLRELHPEWDQSHLEQSKDTLVQRETIERLERERNDIDRERSERVGERRAAEAALASARQQLEQISIDTAVDEFVALIEGSQEYRLNRDQLRELRTQATKEHEQIEAAITKLNSPLGTSLADALRSGEALPVPMETTIVEFRERLSQLEDDLREFQRQAKRTEQERTAKQLELTQYDSSSNVPDREQLLSQRQHRDTGWQILRRRFLDNESLDDAALSNWIEIPSDNIASEVPTVLADAYERAVGAADEIADERQEKYESAAKLDHLAGELKRLQGLLDAETQVIADQQQRLADERDNWRSLWKACPFEPLSPAAMLDWRHDYESLLEQQSHLRELRREADEREAEVSAFESRLANRFSDESADAETLLAQAKQRVDEARNAIADRNAIERPLPEKVQALRVIDEALAELAERNLDWQARWQKLLDEFDFPHEWDVHIAAKILAGLADARKEANRATELEQRIEGMQQTIASFERDVRELSQQIAEDLNDFMPEHLINELFDRLQAAKRAHDTSDRLEKSTAKYRGQLDEAKRKIEEVQKEMSRLLKSAQTDTEREFEQVASAAKRFDELSRTRDETAREIKTIRATEDADRFAEELRAADPIAIAEQQKRLQYDLENAEREANEALAESALKNKEITDMQGGSRAAELAQDLESTRGRLVAAVDRWAPLVLAQAVMHRAIEKFEREHQPAVKASVGRLLEQMTLGRYVAIDRKLDEHGTLLVVDEFGERKEPRQLSTGTREQLYLAIRLAYIQHYCQGAEPLPIVMDDVLVNFDPERAKQTMQVLAEIANDIQIIFLTCHQHMVELVSDILPASKPIILPGGKLTDGQVTSSRGKRRASQSVSSHP